ncbi:MAG: YhbY family RNA-binding protein [Oscillospiraceae bacterium]|nr:YhbY family RNA-binding protein [Oscillospiraceae bacterium]
MLTSKERAELRAQANTLDTTLMVGKGGVTEAVIAEAETQLDARELVKGKVLEGAMMTPREVSDEICEATGADGVAVIGTKFVIYRFSEKLQQARNQTGRAKRKETPSGKKNPVRKGAQARREAARKVRQQRNEYFRQQAIDKAIERDRERQLREGNKD